MKASEWGMTVHQASRCHVGAAARHRWLSASRLVVPLLHRYAGLAVLTKVQMPGAFRRCEHPLQPIHWFDPLGFLACDEPSKGHHRHRDQRNPW